MININKEKWLELQSDGNIFVEICWDMLESSWRIIKKTESGELVLGEQCIELNYIEDDDDEECVSVDSIYENTCKSMASLFQNNPVFKELGLMGENSRDEEAWNTLYDDIDKAAAEVLRGGEVELKWDNIWFNCTEVYSQEMFAEVVNPFIDKIINGIKDSLDKQELIPSDISGILLFGDRTDLPGFAEGLEKQLYISPIKCE